MSGEPMNDPNLVITNEKMQHMRENLEWVVRRAGSTITALRQRGKVEMMRRLTFGSIHAKGYWGNVRYSSDYCVGEGVRWNVDRSRVFRLVRGNVQDKIHLGEADWIAAGLGLPTPP